MHFLSHFRRCGTTGSNCPYRFVGENNTQEALACQAIQSACKLLRYYAMMLPGFPLGQSLSNTDYRLKR